MKVISHGTFITSLNKIIRDMSQDGYKPSIIVGFSRGGAVPAVYLSHYYNCSCTIVDPKFCEDLYVFEGNVLIIDDINDSGNTFNSMCAKFNTTGSGRVKYAAIVNNEASCFKVDYSAIEINKLEDPSWIDFVWENWWAF